MQTGIYHTRRRKQKVKIYCLVCGKTKIVDYSRKKQKFCSRECAKKDFQRRKANFIKRNKETYKDEKVTTQQFSGDFYDSP